MTDEPMTRADREVAGWIEDGPTGAPRSLLGATLEKTRRTSQRAGWMALALGTPSIRTPGRDRARLEPRVAIALLALLLAGALGTALVVGSFLNSQRQVVVAPSATPDAIGPTATSGLLGAGGTTFVIPGSLGLFAVALPSDWHRVATDEAAIRIAVTYTNHEFDPVPTRWIWITAKAQSLTSALSDLVAERGSITPEAIEVNGVHAEMILPLAGSTDDPVALVAQGGLVYRVSVTDTGAPGQSVAFLRIFLARFRALGPAPADRVYQDVVWRFAYAYDTNPSSFGPADELGAGVTRFAYPSCAIPEASGCGGWVDVIRGSADVPLGFDLPGGKPVVLTSSDYPTLAADWEIKVGPSRGSSTQTWQGVPVFMVDNGSIHAAFIFRGNQRLALVGIDADVAGTGEFDSFLNGFVLLP